MTTPKLTQRQLFTMKRATLEKKIIQYYEESNDGSSVVEYAIALMVRHALTLGDYSQMFQQIIVALFLAADSSFGMRQWCPLFRSYFKNEEWETVMTRLFRTNQEYEEVTKATRELIQRGFFTEQKVVGEPEVCSRTLKSIFKDASGKKHTWSLRDYNPANSVEVTRNLLKILNQLTIFEHQGVRRFVTLVKFDSVKLTPEAHFEEPQALVEEATETQPSEEPALSQKEVELNASKAIKSQASQVVVPKKTIEEYVLELQALENIEIALPAGVEPADLTEEKVYDLLRAGIPNGAEIPDEAFRIMLSDLTLMEVAEAHEAAEPVSPIVQTQTEAGSPKRVAAKGAVSVEKGAANDQKSPPIKKAASSQGGESVDWRAEKNENRRLTNGLQKKLAKKGKNAQKKKRKQRRK
ncbi:hypothetical protein CF160_09320 [Enterococcus pseudoavium]|nr:hypothetical protein CF160_09320 [Enterococcus pseudoavium]